MAKAPVRGGRDLARSDSLGPVQVRFYKRMSLRRVYPATVTWGRGERRPPSGAAPVTLRLLMAGAQVVPVEQTLDPNDPDARATFYITPLAKGWLRNEKLEVIVGGRKVQEVPLPCKVTGQTMTWWLLLLAILLPAFLLHYCRFSPLEVTELEIIKSPEFVKEKKLDLYKAKDRLVHVKLLKVKGDKATDTAWPEDMVVHVKVHGYNMDQINDPVSPKVEPGEVLTLRLKMLMPQFLHDALPDLTNDVCVTIGDAYDKVIELERGQRGGINDQRGLPFSFYAFFTFLVLALLSFIFHQDRRSKRQSKPLPLSQGAGSRRDEPVAAELD